MRLNFRLSHERNSINGQEVRQQEHDILPKVRPAHPDAQGKDMRELRVRLICQNEELQVAEGEEEERDV